MDHRFCYFVIYFGTTTSPRFSLTISRNCLHAACASCIVWNRNSTPFRTIFHPVFLTYSKRKNGITALRCVHSKSKKVEFQLVLAKFGGLHNIALVVFGVVTKTMGMPKHPHCFYFPNLSSHAANLSASQIMNFPILDDSNSFHMACLNSSHAAASCA